MVTKVINFRMSKDSMADLLYCLIMSDAKDIDFLGIGISNYSRSQNSYNRCNVIFKCEEKNLQIFKDYKFSLEEGQTININ